MKKITHLILLVTILCSSSMTALAQSNVSGTVSESSGVTLPGVTVLEKGTTNGAITDLDGKYNLRLTTTSATLEFSFVGFESQEVIVNNRTTIDVILSESVSELEEVVVIGYGVQRKKVLTGAVESVSAEEINATPVVSVEQALQGRTPGVQVVNQSGQPGERASVKIRGIGTDFNADPLYIVDGIVVNSIDNLSPGDISSMEVLKDGASTAIYGARGANGVILISTKSGKLGATSITYSGYVGVQNVAKKVDLLNADQYVSVMANAGAENNQGGVFDPNEIPANNTDWQNELFTANAPIESHEVSVSGGSEKTTFASSISYFQQQGIIGGDKSKFERYTARLNSNTKVNDWLDWGNTLSLAHITTRGVASNASFNGAYSSALNMDPLTAVYEDDATVLGSEPYGSNPYVRNDDGRAYAISNNVRGEVVNPLARLDLLNQVVIKDQLLGNVFAEVEPVEGLKLKSSLGVDLSFVGIDSYSPLFYLNSTTNNLGQTGVSKQYFKNSIIQTQNTANYTKKVNDHRFDVLLGVSTHVTNGNNLAGGGQGINTNNPNLRYLNLTIDSTQTSGGAAYEVRRASSFSRILYDYKDRISLSASFRRDGSSNFGANNRYGNFYSVGASWVINEEPFFPEVESLTFLKLRSSWGQNGNDNIRPFAYASLVDFNIAYNLQDGANQGAVAAFVENQDVKWEFTEQVNFAIESGWFDNRLSVSLDFYKKTTVDLLQEQIGLSSIGVPLSYANIGEMENKGFEFDIQWRDRIGEVNYSVGFNGGFNKNTMTEVANEAGFIPGASWALAGEVTRTVEGFPVTSFYGFRTNGIFQNESEILSNINSEGDPIQSPNVTKPGDIRYVDVNGDGMISDDDRTVIGSPIPDWTVGSNISVSYKNFDLYALFTGQFGNEIFNGINRPDIRTSNRQTWILNQWSEDNPSNTIPKLNASDPNENYTRATDLVNIEDGSYVRVKNIQIGYNLPSKVLDKFKFTSWRFYVSGENLLTFTKYSGSDPEVGSPIDFGGSGVASVRDMGIDRGIYPQARTFRIGTSVTF